MDHKGARVRQGHQLQNRRHWRQTERACPRRHRRVLRERWRQDYKRGVPQVQQLCTSCAVWDDFRVQCWWTHSSYCYDMLLHRRVRVKGFICMDHMDELGETMAFMGEHLKSGRVKCKHDVRDGIENFVDVLNLLFSGGN